VRTKKARDVQKRLEFEGWVWQPRRGSGSHRMFCHPQRSGIVIVPWHRNGQSTISPDVFGDIVKKAGWKK
jgi:predicted RNA binding protein YcfA (HicA-like mRNA interferase family)